MGDPWHQQLRGAARVVWLTLLCACAAPAEAPWVELTSYTDRVEAASGLRYHHEAGRGAIIRVHGARPSGVRRGAEILEVTREEQRGEALLLWTAPLAEGTESLVVEWPESKRRLDLFVEKRPGADRRFDEYRAVKAKGRMAEARRLLDTLDGLSPAEERWRVSQRARLAFRSGDLSASLGFCAEAMSLAGAAGRPTEGALHALLGAYYATVRLRLRKALWFIHAAEQATAANDLMGQQRIRYARGMLENRLGRMARSRQAFAEGAALASSIGADHHAGGMRMQQGVVLAEIGRFADALNTLPENDAWGPQSNRIWVELIGSEACALQTDSGRLARDAVEHVEQATPDMLPTHIAEAEGNMAFALLQDGRPDAAAAALAAAWETDPSGGGIPGGGACSTPRSPWLAGSTQRRPRSSARSLTAPRARRDGERSTVWVAPVRTKPCTGGSPDSRSRKSLSAETSV